ncbi:MAG: lipopolysaccharide biosynthesis protein [Chitinophagaceae bacterium]
MSNIRRQSIISSVVIYFGFAVGLLNTYFFTKEGLFTESDYGLITIFMSIATMMMAFSSLAMPSYIFKFYPYYQDNLPVRKNDMITWSILIGLIGFALVMLAGWAFKDLVIRKFGRNSPELLIYYYWIFPMGFGLTIYSILEAYSWSLGKAVLATFLKEVQWRLLTTLFIVFFATKLIDDFSLFIKLYSLGYPIIVVTLFGYLVYTKKIFFTLKVSKVTRRFFRKILTLCSFVYAGVLIFTISRVFDTIVIASVLPDGIDKAGIFGIATIMTSVIQAPQRSIIAVSIPHLSKAWKDKNLSLLQKIYQRSSINLLIFASGIFLVIALNYTEAILAFGLKAAYLQGYSAFILLGLSMVIDLGTGVNAQIIGTSTSWRFELTSGIILLALMLPLTYFLAKQYDIMGPALANLISISIYNSVRISFLWKKFKLFPFSMKSLYVLLIAAVCYVICYLLFNSIHGFTGLVLRTLLFIALYAGSILWFRLSPDIYPILDTIRKRLSGRRREQ